MFHINYSVSTLDSQDYYTAAECRRIKNFHTLVLLSKLCTAHRWAWFQFIISPHMSQYTTHSVSKPDKYINDNQQERETTSIAFVDSSRSRSLLSMLQAGSVMSFLFLRTYSSANNHQHGAAEWTLRVHCIRWLYWRQLSNSSKWW